MSLKNHSDLHTRLRRMFPIGSYMSARVTEVSSSGMTTWIAVYYAYPNQQITNITPMIAKLLGEPLDEGRWAIKRTGANVDLAADLVMYISKELYDGTRSKKLRHPDASTALRYNRI